MNIKNARKTGPDDDRNEKEESPSRPSESTVPEGEPGSHPSLGKPQASEESGPADVDPEELEGVGEAPSKKPSRAEGDEIRVLRHKLKKKDHEIKSARKIGDDLREKYIRLLADMENQRKRLDREKSEFFQFALADVLRELISVLDNFERALKTKDQGDGKSFQEGVELIYRQFLDMIRRLGVSPVETANQKFDPALHQALSSEESDQVSEPVVGEELLKGYRLNDRLLRPAAVKVLVPKKS